ncbi:MAG: Rpn family recombination-promoting nuclease/putative transposase [Lachnospiraceae bacterium]|nr:Rpn family recombination-promoting nuclease/putative transposase [Lachnospiraceae bacterium]
MADNFIMKPKIDYCFKELMGEEKIRNRFIAALLGCTTDDIGHTEIKETILPGDYYDEKISILDVRVELQDNSQISLEMQLSYFASWTKRTVFYISKMITEQLKSGDSYDKIQKCIHVSILDFNRFSDETYYRTFHLADDKSKEIYTDLLEMQILELNKLPADVFDTRNSVESWMRFLRCETREDLAKMAEQNSNLKEAYDHLDKISADEEKRRLYELRERALHDYNTQMESNYKQGLASGFKLGAAILRLYLTEKYSPEEIAEKLGTDIASVNEVINHYTFPAQ